MRKKTIQDIKFEGKKVLIRCDFNVPLDENGNITDNSRIVKALDTVKYILGQNAKVILCSHLGRPKGEVDMKYSLRPVKDELERLLNKEVKLSKDVVGEESNFLVSNMKEGEIVLLENVRFESGETKNDKELSKKFANLADIFVNDAFGAAHRAHSSTVGVTDYIKGYAGFLMEKEIEFLSQNIEEPQRPFLAILGGAKVSDKIEVIKSLINKVDTIVIAGGMSYTFIKALGYNVGTSLLEEDKLEVANEIMKYATSKNVRLVLPTDIVVAKELYPNKEDIQTVEFSNIPEDKMGLDIGENSINNIEKEIRKARTVFWNGPVGFFENPLFLNGTRTIAELIADTDCVSIIGGGDSAAAIKKLNLENKFTHISTGGGASLELIEGKELPGLTCLEDKIEE